MKDRFFKKFFVPLLAVGVVMSFTLYGGFFDTGGGKTVPISIGQKQLMAYVADTESLRERGLGGRNFLLPDEAMLFIFDTPAAYGIWMKDVKFPIDIVWLDPSKRVVSIKERASPSSYPEVFTPEKPARYVLEVSAGFAGENGLKIGEEISF